MAEKRNIFLVGPMGAGKSTIGRHLAQMLHLEFHEALLPKHIIIRNWGVNSIKS